MTTKANAKDLISTADAARGMGVSVSTVKRWVDAGILPAVKTVGGHRKLSVVDLLRAAAAGELAPFDVRQLGVKRPKTLLEDLEPSRRALTTALSQGDGPAARTLLLEAYRAGMPAATLADELIAPAMHQIGHGWETGGLTVMHEHRATQLCTAAVYEIKASLDRQIKPRAPVAVGGAPEGDPYLLAPLLGQIVLLECGFAAVLLGPQTPMDSFRRAVREHQPRLAWISITAPPDVAQFLRDYGAFFVEAERAGVAVAVGGQGLGQSLREQMPFSSYGDKLAHLAAFARSLHPKPQRPRRGRPPKSR